MHISKLADFERLGIAPNTNSFKYSRDGHLIVGSSRALFYLQTSDISMSSGLELRLTDVVINSSIRYNPTELPALDHRNRNISFYYTCLDFNPDTSPRYRYMLEGYDKEWIQAGESTRAAYSNLHSGRYTFKVNVLQPSGEWSVPPASISFRIKPHPLLSWPALLLYLLIIAGASYWSVSMYARLRINRQAMELSRQEKLLTEQVSQERLNFFTNVSHEFRTPLSLIYGPVKELSRSTSIDSSERQLVHTIEKNADRMLRLTDQLLYFNRTAADRDKLAISNTDLSAMLRKMLDNFAYMFNQKNLNVTTELPSGLYAYLDWEKVEKIVFNLISNAVKYTPEHGSITIRAAVKEGVMNISVEDTGIGISPEKAKGIFERYERLGEKVGGELPSGFGIGLNYAQHLAHIHKGRITVRPNYPLGSIFTFSFPCLKNDYEGEALWQEESGNDIATEEESSGPTDGRNVSILVVEDNGDMREYIAGLLEDKFNVTCAGDGEQAWKCIHLSPPDIIVSDVMMPFKDGYTLCKEVKNDPEFCHLPIVLLTAKADMENQLHGLDIGADAYIGKPFDPALLKATVNNILTNRERIQKVLGSMTSASPDPAPELGLGTQDKAFIDKLYSIIDAHISEEEFNVTALSMELGMSRVSLFTKIKALTGESPQAFLTAYRLNRAMELLRQREYNVSEVSWQVGFGSLAGFSRAFKNKFGVPPSSI